MLFKLSICEARLDVTRVQRFVMMGGSPETSFRQDIQGMMWVLYLFARPHRHNFGIGQFPLGKTRDKALLEGNAIHMKQLLSELRRRNIFRVAAAYLVVSWLVMQVVATIGSAAGLPDWTDSFALILLVTGFSIVLFIAWAFELTPEGLKQTEAADPADGAQPMATGDYALMALLVLVLGMAGFQVATRSAAPIMADAADPARETALTPLAPSDASIAVLPFADLSPAGDQQYFSDGMAEEILNVLVRVEGLDVASRTSAFQYRGDAESIPEIAGHLNVRHILEGSVRKDGDTVRITAQLIDASDDRHLWSETFDRPLTTGAIFAVQDEIANAIVIALSEALGVEAVTQVQVEVITENFDAYALFLEARTLFQSRIQLDRADALLVRALEIDPEFSQAWEMRAALVTLKVQYGFSDTDLETAQRLTVEYANRARSIEPRSATAIATLAYVQASRADSGIEAADWAQIFAQFDQALAIEPRNPSALAWSAIALYNVGQLEAALVRLEACVEYEPFYFPCHAQLSLILGALGRNSDAIDAFERGMEIGVLRPEFLILTVPALAGDRMLFLAVTTTPNNLMGWPHHGALYEAIRNPDGDHRHLADQLREFAQQNPDRDVEAIQFLIFLIDPESSTVPERIVYGPVFHRLRQTPEFRTLIRESGIYAYWRDHGYPTMCRPVGPDDFECD